MELISAGLSRLCRLGVDFRMEKFEFDPASLGLATLRASQARAPGIR